MIPTTTFCPHLTYRTSFRRHNRHRCNTEDILDDVCMSDSEVSEEAKRSAASGEPDIGAARRCLSSKSGLQSQISCEECDHSSSLITVSSQNNPAHFWRCLDHRCKIILCGRQAKNHSQLHYTIFRTHVLQENLASKRIWCNECDHEVFPDHRNRRQRPAVWSPPKGSDEDPPKGLYNIGNTCFMNSALQCMTAVVPLNSYFLGQVCNLKGKNVGSSYLWLLHEMWSETEQSYQKGVMPSRLLHAVRAAHPIFRGFQQHDTQEFLRLFMDSLAEETRVPHFYLETVEEKNHSSGSDDGTTSSDSETESFETCDSGNASEETMSTDIQGGDCGDKNTIIGKEVKIAMKSIVSEIFDGQVKSEVECLSCKQTSSRFEVFQDLSLPIPTREELSTIKNSERFDDDGLHSIGWIGWLWDWMRGFFWGPSPTLEDCFSAFFSSDELKGKNMYSCEKCRKLRNGVKRCSLYLLPEVLCVHLKRFRMYEYSGGMGFSGKVSQYVQFPLDNLDLRPYLHKECPNQTTNYRLIGAICHIGSFLGGHYTAYIRRGTLWYLCDDSRVVGVTPETVAESEAYVLFYQKCDEEIISIKQHIISEWELAENVEEKLKFHLISRKWLTQFFWGQESGPIDNNDVVCPHGYIVPYEAVHLGATWVPEPVWNILVHRYGGGPDLQHAEECLICAAAWRKYQKSTQKPKGTPFPEASSSGDHAVESRNRSLFTQRE